MCKSLFPLCPALFNLCLPRSSIVNLIVNFVVVVVILVVDVDAVVFVVVGSQRVNTSGCTALPFATDKANIIQKTHSNRMTTQWGRGKGLRSRKRSSGEEGVGGGEGEGWGWAGGGGGPQPRSTLR